MPEELLDAIDEHCKVIGMARNEFLRRGAILHLRLVPIPITGELSADMDWTPIIERINALKGQGGDGGD
jgi:hypothetical protein